MREWPNRFIQPSPVVTFFPFPSRKQTLPEVARRHAALALGGEPRRLRWALRARHRNPDGATKSRLSSILRPSASEFLRGNKSSSLERGQELRRLASRFYFSPDVEVGLVSQWVLYVLSRGPQIGWVSLWDFLLKTANNTDGFQRSGPRLTPRGTSRGMLRPCELPGGRAALQRLAVGGQRVRGQGDARQADASDLGGRK